MYHDNQKVTQFLVYSIWLKFIFPLTLSLYPFLNYIEIQSSVILDKNTVLKLKEILGRSTILMKFDRQQNFLLNAFVLRQKFDSIEMFYNLNKFKNKTNSSHHCFTFEVI